MCQKQASDFFTFLHVFTPIVLQNCWLIHILVKWVALCFAPSWILAELDGCRWQLVWVLDRRVRMLEVTNLFFSGGLFFLLLNLYEILKSFLFFCSCCKKKIKMTNSHNMNHGDCVTERVREVLLLLFFPNAAALDVTTWKWKPMPFAVISAHVVVSGDEWHCNNFFY